MGEGFISCFGYVLLVLCWTWLSMLGNIEGMPGEVFLELCVSLHAGSCSNLNKDLHPHPIFRKPQSYFHRIN